MKLRLACLLALLGLVPAALASLPQVPAPQVAATEAPKSWKEEPGPRVPKFLDELWRDAKRERDVPVRIFHPALDTAKAGETWPVVIFSHGLGGTRENYGTYGRHWSSWGYVVVHVQHLGSDDSVWRGNPQPMEAMQKAALDPANLLGRPDDIHFVIDELGRRSQAEGWPLAGRLDLAHLAVAGHSFGAYTALAAGGRDLVHPVTRAKTELGDARVKCVIAMSPQGKAHERANLTWEDFATPAFHMTGTKDESPIRGDSTPAERRIPFDTITRAEQFLLILDGARHDAFGDADRPLRRRDTSYMPLILPSSTAFLDAYLKGDAAALAWLRDGGFKARLGAGGTFETKLPAPAPQPTPSK
jgi:predicted dienelactone hydrolase